MVICIFGVGTATAQTVDHGLRLPRNPTASESGIEAYTLVTRGETAAIEVFGPKSQAIATCAMEWLPGSTVMTCSLEGRGGQYRVTWIPKGAEFEDLITGDRFQVGVAWEKPLPDSFELQPGDSPPAGEWEFSFEGTVDKKEAEAKWGHITRLFGLLAAEVETTLSKGANLRSSKSLERPFLGPPEKAQICPDGQFPDCSDSFGFIGSGFATDANRCCVLASSDADLKCSIHTGSKCCANTFCTVGCTLGIFCSCSVGGLTWQCPPPCV